MGSRATRTVLALLAIGAAPALTAPLLSQESILLRYHPYERLSLHTISWLEADVKMEMSGFMSLFAALGEGLAEAFGGDTAGASFRDSLEAAMSGAPADSLAVRMEMQSFLTEEVLQAQPGHYLIYRAVDSTRARMRAEGEDWEPAPPGEFPPTAAQFVLDDRLRLSEFRLAWQSSASEKMEGTLRAPRGGFELELPEDAVSPGSTWSTTVTFPMDLTEEMELGEEAPGGGNLIARASVTLDSLVDRGADTLAYLRIGGPFEQLNFDGAALQGTTTVEGQFAGVLVWSTAWNAFVSGASRSTFSARFEFGSTEAGAGAGAGESLGIGMRFDIVNRFQVRP